MLVALRVCLLPILKPYLNREKVNLVFSFEYNIIDPAEKFLLVVSFLMLIRYQSKKKLQNLREYNQMFSSKQLRKRIVTFKSGIIQNDGHFNENDRDDKKHGSKKTVQKSINYVDERYSTILYDEEKYEESSSSSDDEAG
jgi:hypothetical protein